MMIKAFRIRNYKSFRDSNLQELGPGFNIVIGANNSGKTALTEALSTRFINHTSSDEASSVHMVFRANRAEILEAIRSVEIQFPIAPPATSEDVKIFFDREYIDSETVYLSNENTNNAADPSHKLFEYDAQHDKEKAQCIVITFDLQSQSLP
jgi:AAA15 family ATPase/GTPase